jgi:hypothetical protein
MKTTTLYGIEYQILNETTPEAAEANGQHHLAAHLRARGIGAQIYLIRPNGRKLFVAYQDDQGRIGAPVPIAR